MIILNLEVIDLDGSFQKLMLHFFNDDILAVDEDENISRTEMRRACPAVYRRIEWMLRCSDDLLTVYVNMHQFRRFAYKRIFYALERHVSTYRCYHYAESSHVLFSGFEVSAVLFYQIMPVSYILTSLNLILI